MTHAQSKFSSPGVLRLGIPENWMSDGPHDVREELLWDQWNIAKWTNDSCIAFPALTCLAATWNIYRSPLNGRNFEYMGEDPFGASRMVVPYIKGVQKNGVAVCVKHYALNIMTMRNTNGVVEPGEFRALIGASSADIRSSVKFKLR